MSDLEFDSTTTSLILGDERTRSGEIQLRLVGTGERHDGGGVCSVWEWTYRSNPNVAKFAGTIRAPDAHDIPSVCNVASGVLREVERLMLAIDSNGRVGTFRDHVDDEVRNLSTR